MKVVGLLLISPRFHCFCGGCMQNYYYSDAMHTPYQTLSPEWIVGQK